MSVKAPPKNSGAKSSGHSGNPGAAAKSQPAPLSANAGRSQAVTSEQLAAAFDLFPTVEPGDRRSFPETKQAQLALVRQLQKDLGVQAPSESLNPQQLALLFERVAKAYGLRPEFLHYMAGAESGAKQTADNGAAHGIMQIERAAHPDAFSGAVNVGNDTVSNVVYGALLRAQTDRALAQAFRSEGLTAPARAGVVEFLGDLAYNRGPALLRRIAEHARTQGIDVNRFADYVAGPDGSFELRQGKVTAKPAPGNTRITPSGTGSVLALALADVNRKNPVRLSSKIGDRNADGQVSHLDVWVTRGLRYIDFLLQEESAQQQKRSAARR